MERGSGRRPLLLLFTVVVVVVRSGSIAWSAGRLLTRPPLDMRLCPNDVSKERDPILHHVLDCYLHSGDVLLSSDLVGCTVAKVIRSKQVPIPYSML